MRLDKFLADCGIGSRREIKQILKTGTVLVNGKCVKRPEFSVTPEEDTVTVNGERAVYRQFVYLMLNKPSGYVSAVFDNRLKTVIELVPPEFSHYDLHPVGRLDYDTEGLLILTNDGALTHRVISPKSHVDKTYLVKTLLPIEDRYEKEFMDGVTLDDGYKTMSAKITKGEEENTCTLVIREGKFHQVKRMMEAVGNKVTYLKRIKIGSLHLDESLNLGEMRLLTEEELILLEEKSQWI